jgi:methionyl-tRNA synthetase
MYQLSEALRHIGLALLPVIPAGATKVLANLSVDAEKASWSDRSWGGLKPGASIMKGDILFPRLEVESKA